MSSPPNNLKPITKYLARAKEMDKADPIIAYYCRSYAVQLGIQLKKDKEDMTYLGGLLSGLEDEKRGNAKLKNMSKQEGIDYCEKFGLTIFARADNVDRKGSANKSTALSFQASSIFLEIIGQFGDLSDDLKEKIKYARWRAVEINKALAAGEKPPLPPGVEEDETPSSSSKSSSSRGGNSSKRGSSSSIPSSPTPTVPDDADTGEDESAPRLVRTDSYQIEPSGLQIKSIDTAKKHARFAISALEFDDVPHAIRELEAALSILKKK